MFSNISLNFVSDIGVADHTMIDYTENKIENLHLQECSLTNRSFSNLVIWLETYIKKRQNFTIMLYRILNPS